MAPTHKLNLSILNFKKILILKNMKAQNPYLSIETQEFHSNFYKKVQINWMKSKEISKILFKSKVKI